MKKLVRYYAVIAAMCLTACGITPTDDAVETTVSVSETTAVNEEILRADSIGHNEQPQNGESEDIKICSSNLLPETYSLSGFEQAADEIDVTFENSELVAEEMVIEGDGGVFADVYSHNISVMNNTYHELVYIKDGAAEKMYGGFIHGRITTACADGREFAVVVPEVWMTPADIDPVTPCRAFTSLNGRPVEVTCGERQLYAYLKDPVQLMALNDDGDEIWCHKDTEKINSGKYIQQLIFEDGVLTVTDEAAVPTAQEQAEVFAELVYQKLEDEKNSENPTGFFPVDSDREQPKTSFDPEGFNADIFLLDVNSDGVPELFAGTHGTMGNGNYTVFSADGTVYGSDIFSWNFIDYCQINETMYVKSGNNFYGGWVKLTEGLPSIYVHNYDLEGSSNEVDFRIGGEVKEKWTGLSFDEVKELYTEFLDVDYDKLKGQEDICHVRGVLEVPDPENYTKEDIYSCLEALTAEYEKNSPIKASAVQENTEDFVSVGCEKGIYNSTELETAEKTLFTGEYENRSEFKSEEYSAVSAYTIENSGEYSENAELLKKAEYDGRILFRHIKIIDENVNISWYDSGFAPAEAPYKYQDVTRSMEKVPLRSDKGRELFPEDEKFAEENGSDAGQVHFMNIDLDGDGSEDTLAFVTAPWIQGQNHNITLSVRTSDGKTVTFAEPVYMLTDDNGIVMINICRTFTNGMPDFEMETIDYTTSACTVRRYKFNGIEYVKET
ncbi:MAG: hypothetical protein IJZ72_03015 [Oscillospiraceae bacterium]|nr:hypothetical protein [Oscillospiraceae bacterium]